MEGVELPVTDWPFVHVFSPYVYMPYVNMPYICANKSIYVVFSNQHADRILSFFSITSITSTDIFVQKRKPNKRLTVVVCMTNTWWPQSSVSPGVRRHLSQFNSAAHLIYICILILFKLFVQCFACIYMVLRGKFYELANLKFKCVVPLGQGEKRNFQRNNFLERIKLFADDQKPVLPCTE